MLDYMKIKELKLSSNTLFLGNLWKYFCLTIQLVCVRVYVCVCVCVFVLCVCVGGGGRGCSHAYKLKYKVQDKHL